MVLGFRTNLFAEKALSGLAQSSRALGGIYERLSSGQRINRAADDAAGLSISNYLSKSLPLCFVCESLINSRCWRSASISNNRLAVSSA